MIDPRVIYIVEKGECPGVNEHGCGNKFFFIERIVWKFKMYKITCVAGHSFFVDQGQLLKEEHFERTWPKIVYEVKRETSFVCRKCHKLIKGPFHYKRAKSKVCPICEEKYYPSTYKQLDIKWESFEIRRTK